MEKDSINIFETLDNLKKNSLKEPAIKFIENNLLPTLHIKRKMYRERSILWNSYNEIIEFINQTKSAWK